MKTASRVSAALFVTYLATGMVAYALARILPLAPTEAIIVTSLLGILMYVGLMLWAFVAELQTVFVVLVALTLGGAVLAMLIEAVQ